jgi:Domain of unknown function (DUF4288)
MSWFITKIVFNIVTFEIKSHFEEQLRLVEADSTEGAFLKARAIGIGLEETWQEGNLSIKREFVDVAELHTLGSLKNGAEIYSQIHETEKPKAYIQIVHQQGVAIRMNVL